METKVRKVRIAVAEERKEERERREETRRKGAE